MDSSGGMGGCCSQGFLVWLIVFWLFMGFGFEIGFWGWFFGFGFWGLILGVDYGFWVFGSVGFGWVLGFGLVLAWLGLAWLACLPTCLLCARYTLGHDLIPLPGQ